MSRTSSPSASSSTGLAGAGGRSRSGVPAVVCRPAATEDELAAHMRIRRQVFVEAQGVFVDEDRDERDADSATVHVVGFAGGEVVGAVRLYPLDADGLWQGDRLAVLPHARALQMGGDLVRCAVATAAAAGGRRMLAKVQPQNVRFFERLGWHVDGAPALYHGIEHQPMAIGLGEGESVSSPPAA